MSTAPPTPVPPAARRRRGWLLFLCLLPAVLAAVVAGVVAAWPRRPPPDDSIVVDEVRENSPGIVLESGRIYTQATVDLPPGAELVLPVTKSGGVLRVDDPPLAGIRVLVRSDGEPGQVRILMQHNYRFGGSPPQSVRLRDLPQGKDVWKRQKGAVLTIDVKPGYSHRHGGSFVEALFIVPPGQALRQAPSSAPEFDDRYWFRGSDERDQYTEDADARAAGWEEVPQQPLPQSQFR